MHSFIRLFVFISTIILTSSYVSTAQTTMENPTVIIETTQGNIEIRLFPEIAPKACENFLKHAENGYYDNVIFHRVIQNFMIQGGDPQGNGTGGESIWKTPFEDEVSPDVKFDREGILAMANAGPSTNGSQFFITTTKTPWLHMKHTIFGEVVSGYDIVKNIEQTPTDAMDRPLIEQKILGIKLREHTSAAN